MFYSQCSETRNMFRSKNQSYQYCSSKILAAAFPLSPGAPSSCKTRKGLSWTCTWELFRIRLILHVDEYLYGGLQSSIDFRMTLEPLLLECIGLLTVSLLRVLLTLQSRQYCGQDCRKGQDSSDVSHTQQLRLAGSKPHQMEGLLATCEEAAALLEMFERHSSTQRMASNLHAYPML